MWRPPMQQQQPEEMQHKQPLTVNFHITDQKFQIFGFKASSIVLWFGHQTVARTQQSQTLKRAVMVNKCQQNHLSTDGSMKFK